MLWHAEPSQGNVIKETHDGTAVVSPIAKHRVNSTHEMVNVPILQKKQLMLRKMRSLVQDPCWFSGWSQVWDSSPRNPQHFSRDRCSVDSWQLNEQPTTSWESSQSGSGVWGWNSRAIPPLSHIRERAECIHQDECGSLSGSSRPKREFTVSL